MDQITEQPMPETQPVAPVSVQTVKNTKKTKILIIGSVIVLLIIAIAVWRIYIKHRTLTPEETLQQLKDTSQPVTATPSERKADLEDLKKQSAPIKATSQDSLNMLQQLRK